MSTNNFELQNATGQQVFVQQVLTPQPLQLEEQNDQNEQNVPPAYHTLETKTPL